jgi:aminoglycoside phosphotransferase (APT) family kinase protein
MERPASSSQADQVPGLDLGKLARYLPSVLDDFDPAAGLSARLLAGGRSNLTCLLSQPGGAQWVLRRPPLGHLTPTAHDMGREFRTLSLLRESAYPAPRPRALCTDAAVLGATFMIYEYVPGLIVADPATAARFTAPQAGQLCGSLVTTLARLHAIALPPADPGRSSSSVDYLRRQLARWTGQWERNKTAERPEFGQLARWLETAIARLTADYPVTIVHGDYRLDNVVLDDGSLEVRAVLDWEMSTLGDPLTDIAVLLAYWEQPGDTLRAQVSVARQLTTPPGFWSRAELLDHYLAAATVPGDHLDVCLALVCLKLAAIMEGIHRRHLDGAALDGLSAGMAGGAPALLQMGLLVADGEGVAALAG